MVLFSGFVNTSKTRVSGFSRTWGNQTHVGFAPNLIITLFGAKNELQKLPQICRNGIPGQLSISINEDIINLAISNGDSLWAKKFVSFNQLPLYTDDFLVFEIGLFMVLIVIYWKSIKTVVLSLGKRISR
mgnify:CR=1 FL=1